MSKLIDNLENPIDIFFYKLCGIVSPLFKSLNHTPNIITTYSLIIGVMAVYYLNIGDVNMFSLLFILYYFFDCLDGYFARKYNMVTEFGDKYDHIKDIIIFLMITYIVYIKYSHNITYGIIFIFIIFLFLMGCHLGCQQSIYNGEYEETLSIFKPLCFSPKNQIQITKYFGCGTFVFVILIIIHYLHSIT